MIYFDNAATTYPKPKEIYDYIDYLNRNYSFNSGRGSYKKAQEVTNMIEASRSAVSNVVNANTTVFSSSATFALNQIIYGLDLNEYSNVYYSPYEHNAVMRTLHQRSKEIGFKMIEIPLNVDSLSVDVDKLAYMYAKNNPSAVFCIHVSNVTGYILPIDKIGELTSKYNATYIVDAAQSFGMIPIDMKKSKIDFVVFAGHKTLYSTFGVGGFCALNLNALNLYFVGGTGSDSLNLEMPIDGETRYEPSSHNATAIITLQKSIQWLEDNKNLIEHEQNMFQILINKLKKLPNVKLYIDDCNDYFGVVSINVIGYKSVDVGMILSEDYDICVRTGYHCAPIIHNYLYDEDYLGTVRISLGLFNDINDIDKLIVALEEL